MPKLADLEGVGAANSRKLKKAGVTSINTLLEKGSTPKGRKEISAKSGIPPKLILEWVNHVDLFRIKGVAGEYADLLEAAGVDTVVELAQRTAKLLFAGVVEANKAKKLVRKLPADKEIASWIQQAKKLSRKISY